MRYEWANGARVEGSAQPIGERIERLRVTHGGTVTPDVLVEDAEAPESPLHPCFEWDDDEAAKQYRLEQARLVLRSLVVTIVEDRRLPIRAFVAVKEDDEPGRSYTSVQDALQDEGMRKQLLDSALREIKSWRQRYSRLQELARLFSVVDQFDIAPPD